MLSPSCSQFLLETSALVFSLFPVGFNGTARMRGPSCWVNSWSHASHDKNMCDERNVVEFLHASERCISRALHEMQLNFPRQHWVRVSTPRQRLSLVRFIHVPGVSHAPVVWRGCFFQSLVTAASFVYLVVHPSPLAQRPLLVCRSSVFFFKELNTIWVINI